jgi:hypothetical protein
MKQRVIVELEYEINYDPEIEKTLAARLRKRFDEDVPHGSVFSSMGISFNYKKTIAVYGKAPK